MGIVLEHFEMRKKHPNQALDIGMIDEPKLSSEAISDVMQGRMVRMEGMRTLQDMRLMYLSWIFDINFPFTLACMRERGYLEKLLAGLPDDVECNRAKGTLRRHLYWRGEMFI
jgi:hypothetical protein